MRQERGGNHGPPVLGCPDPPAVRRAVPTTKGATVSTTGRLLAGTAACAAIAVLLWWWLAPARTTELQLPATEEAQLAATVLPLVESNLADAGSGERLACAVKVFGAEPADARTAETVTTAYVQTLCATLGTPVRTESKQPAVVRLGSPVQVEVPGTVAYADRVRSLFPERLQDSVSQAGDLDLDADLEKRVEELGFEP